MYAPMNRYNPRTYIPCSNERYPSPSFIASVISSGIIPTQDLPVDNVLNIPISWKQYPATTSQYPLACKFLHRNHPFHCPHNTTAHPTHLCRRLHLAIFLHHIHIISSLEPSTTLHTTSMPHPLIVLGIIRLERLLRHRRHHRMRFKSRQEVSI